MPFFNLNKDAPGKWKVELSAESVVSEESEIESSCYSSTCTQSQTSEKCYSPTCSTTKGRFPMEIKTKIIYSTGQKGLHKPLLYGEKLP